MTRNTGRTIGLRNKKQIYENKHPNVASLSFPRGVCAYCYSDASQQAWLVLSGDERT